MDIFERLEAEGITFTETDTSSSSGFEVNGIPVGGSTKFGVRYEWMLPKAPVFEASFTKEGLGKQFLKLFKSELQTGEALFDDLVYIATKDKEATGAFLDDEKIRDVVSTIVGEGGSIVVENQRVIYNVDGGLTPEQRDDMGLFVGKVAGVL